MGGFLAGFGAAVGAICSLVAVIAFLIHRIPLFRAVFMGFVWALPGALFGGLTSPAFAYFLVPLLALMGFMKGGFGDRKPDPDDSGSD
jgi:hypothetical protein